MKSETSQHEGQEQTGALLCPLATPCQDACQFSVDEAFCRFEGEAVRGVCDTGRYRCPFYAWGEGPPLLFIHGLGDVARAYVPVISLLASSFRCIAYDLPS